MVFPLFLFPMTVMRDNYDISDLKANNCIDHSFNDLTIHVMYMFRLPSLEAGLPLLA